MQRKPNGPMEDAPQAGRSSRRDLLKRALVVLGAGVLIQPNGGMSGLALADSAPAPKPKKKNQEKCKSTHPPSFCNPPKKPNG